MEYGSGICQSVNHIDKQLSKGSNKDTNNLQSIGRNQIFTIQYHTSNIRYSVVFLRNIPHSQGFKKLYRGHRDDHRGHASTFDHRLR